MNPLNTRSPLPLQNHLEMNKIKSLPPPHTRRRKTIRFRGTTPVHTRTGMHSCGPGYCHPDPPVLTARLRLRLLRRALSRRTPWAGCSEASSDVLKQPLRTNQRLS